MKLSISEILNTANKLTGEQQIDYLRQNNSVLMETILRGAFDETIVWALPLGSPPYKPIELVDQQHVLFHECRKMYLFIQGGHDNLKQQKREKIFIELLETVDPEDAKLLIAVKDKTLPYLNITPSVVNKAFPGILTK